MAVALKKMTPAELRRWFRDPGDLEVWEDIASWFCQETGHLRPGKSKPLGWHMEADGEPDCCRDAWLRWSEQKRSEAVRGLLDQRDHLLSLLAEWSEPGDCGCETDTCTGLCLAARTRAAVND